MRQVLLDFFEQSKTVNLFTNKYPKLYQGLKVVVSFGKGNPAKVPWISFLGTDQKTSDGIYPILLYFKQHEILILAYGISEIMPPIKNWKLSSESKTIGRFFQDLGIPNNKYLESLVYKSYVMKEGTDYETIINDLDTLIVNYKKQIP